MPPTPPTLVPPAAGGYIPPALTVPAPPAVPPWLNSDGTPPAVFRSPPAALAAPTPAGLPSPPAALAAPAPPAARQPLFNSDGTPTAAYQPPGAARPGADAWAPRLAPAYPQEPKSPYAIPPGLAGAPPAARQPLFNSDGTPTAAYQPPGAVAPGSDAWVRQMRLSTAPAAGSDYVTGPDRSLLDVPLGFKVRDLIDPEKQFGVPYRTENVLSGTAVGEYEPTVGDAAMALPGLGLAAKAPRAAGIAGEAVSGVGALRNFGQGVANLGRGTVNLARGGTAAELAAARTQLGTGLAQAGLKAPLHSLAPAVTSGAVQQLAPTADAVTPATKWTAPSGLGGGPLGRYAAPAAIGLRTLGALGPESGVPTAPEYIGNNIRNLGLVGGAARKSLPAAERVVGNAIGDVGRGLNVTATNPAARYEELSRQYATAQAAGAPPEQLKAIRDEVATLRHPADPGAATNVLLAEEAARRLAAQYPAGHPLHAQAQAEAARITAAAGSPLVTARDLETARAQAGLLPGVDQAGRRAKFDARVGGIVGGFNPSAAPAPAADPAATAAPTPATPSAAASPDRPQSQPAPTLPPAAVAAAPELGDPATVRAAGAKLTSIVGAAGGPAGAAAVAAQAPPPPGFEGYWAGLSDESKVLALAGLSITAIGALQSLFGGDDEEGEGGGGFLQRVLPFLGVGAAAWGLGGGTVGLTEPFATPKLDTYKQLGNAGASALGVGTLFN